MNLNIHLKTPAYITIMANNIIKLSEKPFPWEQKVCLTGDNLRTLIRAVHTAKYISHETEICDLGLENGNRWIFTVHPTGYMQYKSSPLMAHTMIHVPKDVLAHQELNLFYDGTMYTIAHKLPSPPKRPLLGKQHYAILRILKENPHGLTAREIVEKMRLMSSFENVDRPSVTGRCSELLGMGRIASGGKVVDEESNGRPSNVWVLMELM